MHRFVPLWRDGVERPKKAVKHGESAEIGARRASSAWQLFQWSDDRRGIGNASAQFAEIAGSPMPPLPDGRGSSVALRALNDRGVS